MPGMDVRAALTVVADGPVGAVGPAARRARSGMPEGHAPARVGGGDEAGGRSPRGHARSRPAPSSTPSAIPEPEIFGFLYVHPDRVASVGIFVPSWFDSPVRTSYRYLQHYVQHPACGATSRRRRLRSWGAKSLQESGRRGEPFLVRRRLRPHRRGLRVAPTCSPARAWTRPGPPACSWPRACSSCSRPGSPSPARTWSAAYVARRRAELGRGARGGWPRRPATGSSGAWSPGCSAWRSPDSAAAAPRSGRSRRTRRAGGDAWRTYYAGRIPPDEIARIRAECRAEGGAAPRRPHGPRRLAADPLSTASCWSRSRTRCSWAARCRRRPATPTTWSSSTRSCAGAAARSVCVEICSAEAIRPGERRDARLRSREVRPLRRLPVELPHAACPAIRARQHRVPRRRGRAALGGELSLTGEPDVRIPDRGLREHRPRPPADPRAGGHGASGPGLKNELMLPHVLDPWAGHALYEAAHLAAKVPGGPR